MKKIRNFLADPKQEILNMKKIFILPILVLSVLLTISMVSAGAQTGKVVIAGKIYNNPDLEIANGIEGASVNATCNNNVGYDTSLADGTYSITFTLEQCPNNSIVTVWAEKDGIINSGEGIVHDYTAIIPELYLGIANIPLVPEFGVIAGLATILGAFGIFFVVRKK